MIFVSILLRTIRSFNLVVPLSGFYSLLGAIDRYSTMHQDIYIPDNLLLVIVIIELIYECKGQSIILRVGPTSLPTLLVFEHSIINYVRNIRLLLRIWNSCNATPWKFVCTVNNTLSIDIYWKLYKFWLWDIS